jgi:asparagine synthase (glutamine-hydrolysing)
VCGIAGYVSFDGRPGRDDEARTMIATLRHRGPDWSGVHVGGPAALAMSRLSIIDLAGGSRMIGNEDGSIRVAFNGEIYNHRALRRELETRGHRFATSTDTETVVHLYEELGVRAVERLRGMFAFALWDERHRRLVLARDRLGIKPLYWGRFGDRLAFGSEVKAVLACPGVPREIDWASVDHLFAAMTTPADASIVHGVRKLLPGHVLTATADGTVAIERYWELRFDPDRSRDEGSWIEELRAKLDETVRSHLVADVPLGAFLSGGIDSSAVVATMARVGDGDAVRTFSIGFAEPSHDESPWARLVARHVGVEHHERILDPEIAGFLDELTWHLDEPFGDTSAIPTWLVSRLASEHVKVVLSGDGGDELFAGYDRYAVEERERALARRLPGSARRMLGWVASHLPDGARGRNLLRHFSLADAERYLDAVTLFRREERRRLFRPEIHALFPAVDPLADEAERLRAARGPWLSALQALDVRRYLPLDILTKVDRMSMAWSLEARVPLLDHELVELAARIPPEMHLADGSGKRLFKRAVSDRVPQAILDRPKRGFAVPLDRWFRGSLGPFVRDLLDSDRTRSRGVFDPVRVRQLIERQAAGRELDLHLWTMISFELWCRRFLDRPVAAGAAERDVPHVAPTVPAPAAVAGAS